MPRQIFIRGDQMQLTSRHRYPDGEPAIKSCKKVIASDLVMYYYVRASDLVMY